ncbi:hypothetical protein L3X38_040686 [Prunus dulcis]|uniref:Uncharacterized protein n=1 Tax=Prunus dulcis TaxID=3755 RepID=A0AAD4YUC4_PRUDU|nr:hypothetical protein L3X38_040686 [Prunus dulcis]
MADSGHDSGGDGSGIVGRRVAVHLAPVSEIGPKCGGRCDVWKGGRSRASTVIPASSVVETHKRSLYHTVLTQTPILIANHTVPAQPLILMTTIL